MNFLATEKPPRTGGVIRAFERTLQEGLGVLRTWNNILGWGFPDLSDRNNWHNRDNPGVDGEYLF